MAKKTEVPNVIEHEGVELDRLPFVADAAVEMAAASENYEHSFYTDHKGRAAWAVEAAEALWVELARRYGDE